MPLIPEVARRVYDRVGARQDAQGWYEDAAIERLLERVDFTRAHRVLEFGCGTGRLARRLLEGPLPAQARYLGVDVSPVMVDLARRRLAPFEEGAEVRLVDGAPRIPVPDSGLDLLLSTYVFDLLPEAHVRAVLADAHRALRPGGAVALAGLTAPVNLSSRIVMGLWSTVHAVAPRLVGGCRPLRMERFLNPQQWRVRHRSVVTPRGVASEVLVVEKPAG